MFDIKKKKILPNVLKDIQHREGRINIKDSVIANFVFSRTVSGIIPNRAPENNDKIDDILFFNDTFGNATQKLADSSPFVNTSEIKFHQIIQPEQFSSFLIKPFKAQSMMLSASVPAISRLTCDVSSSVSFQNMSGSVLTLTSTDGTTKKYIPFNKILPSRYKNGATELNLLNYAGGNKLVEPNSAQNLLHFHFTLSQIDSLNTEIKSAQGKYIVDGSTAYIEEVSARGHSSELIKVGSGADQLVYIPHLTSSYDLNRSMTAYVDGFHGYDRYSYTKQNYQSLQAHYKMTATPENFGPYHADRLPSYSEDSTKPSSEDFTLETFSISAVAKIECGNGANIHGLTAGQKITITNASGEMIDYFVSDTADGGVANGAAVADNVTLKSTGDIRASRTPESNKGVAVGFDLGAALPGGTDQGEFLNLLKNAIEGETGHNGSIVCSVVYDKPSSNRKVLAIAQKTGGPAGDLNITEDMSSIVRLGSGFSGGRLGVRKLPVTNFNSSSDNDDKLSIGTAAHWNTIIGSDSETIAATNGRFSFSVWVYKLGHGGGGVGRILDFGDGDIALYTDSDGKVCLDQKRDVAGNLVTHKTTEPAVFLGVWTHIQVNYNGTGTPTCSVNNESFTMEITAGSAAGTKFGVQTEGCFIGNNASGNKGFVGKISEVAIWANSVMYSIGADNPLFYCTLGSPDLNLDTTTTIAQKIVSAINSDAIFEESIASGVVPISYDLSTIIGSNTNFVSRLKVGDKILANGIEKTVASIIDETRITVTEPFSSTIMTPFNVLKRKLVASTFDNALGSVVKIEQTTPILSTTTGFIGEQIRETLQIPEPIYSLDLAATTPIVNYSRSSYANSLPDIDAPSYQNGVDGELKRITTTTTADYGRTYNAANFTADNHLIKFGKSSQWQDIIGHDTAAGSNQKMSFSAWVYPTSFGTSDYPRIVDFGGELFVYIVNDDSDSGNNNRKIGFYAKWDNFGDWRTNSYKISTNQWNLVTVTYDATDKNNQPSIYINGAAQTVETITAPIGTYIGINNNTDAACIGNRHDGNRGFRGSIAEPKIWNEILDPTMVKYLFRDQGPTESHIELYFPANFMSGSISAVSFSGKSQNHASLHVVEGIDIHRQESIATGKTLIVSSSQGEVTFTTDQNIDLPSETNASNYKIGIQGYTNVSPYNSRLRDRIFDAVKLAYKNGRIDTSPSRSGKESIVLMPTSAPSITLDFNSATVPTPVAEKTQITINDGNISSTFQANNGSTTVTGMVYGTQGLSTSFEIARQFSETVNHSDTTADISADWLATAAEAKMTVGVANATTSAKAGNAITLISSGSNTASLTKVYVIVDAPNSNDKSEDDDANPGHPLVTGDELAAGDIIGTGITLAADDFRVGSQSVAVALDLSNSKNYHLLDELKTAINHTRGHNAGVANSKIELGSEFTGKENSSDDAELGLKQAKRGSAGNTTVENSISGLAASNFRGGTDSNKVTIFHNKRGVERCLSVSGNALGNRESFVTPESRKSFGSYNQFRTQIRGTLITENYITGSFQTPQFTQPQLDIPLTGEILSGYNNGKNFDGTGFLNSKDPRVGSVVFEFFNTGTELLTNLAKAVNHKNGHNGKILANVSGPSGFKNIKNTTVRNNKSRLELVQSTGGTSGNTDVTFQDDTGETLNQRLRNLTFTDFVGGADRIAARTDSYGGLRFIGKRTYFFRLRTSKLLNPSQFVAGKKYEIVNTGNTTFTDFTAGNNNVGTTFTMDTDDVSAMASQTGRAIEFVSADLSDGVIFSIASSDLSRCYLYTTDKGRDLHFRCMSSSGSGYWEAVIERNDTFGSAPGPLQNTWLNNEWVTLIVAIDETTSPSDDANSYMAIYDSENHGGLLKKVSFTGTSSPGPNVRVSLGAGNNTNSNKPEHLPHIFLGYGNTSTGKAEGVFQTTKFNLTGTIDPTASTTVTGTNTAFQSELSAGDQIVVSGETRIVQTVNSDTELTVTVAFSDNGVDTAPYRLNSLKISDFYDGFELAELTVLDTQLDTTRAAQIAESHFVERSKSGFRSKPPKLQLIDSENDDSKKTSFKDSFFLDDATNVQMIESTDVIYPNMMPAGTTGSLAVKIVNSSLNDAAIALRLPDNRQFQCVFDSSVNNQSGIAGDGYTLDEFSSDIEGPPGSSSPANVASATLYAWYRLGGTPDSEEPLLTDFSGNGRDLSISQWVGYTTDFEPTVIPNFSPFEGRVTPGALDLAGGIPFNIAKVIHWNYRFDAANNLRENPDPYGFSLVDPNGPTGHHRAFSISVWLNNPANIYNSNQNVPDQIIASKKSQNLNFGWTLRLKHTGDPDYAFKLEFEFKQGNEHSIATSRDYIIQNRNQWRHIVVTYSGRHNNSNAQTASTTKFYVDKTAVNIDFVTTSGFTGITNASSIEASLAIGSRTEFSTNDSDLRLAEIAFWEANLTATNVADIYDAANDSNANPPYFADSTSAPLEKPLKVGINGLATDNANNRVAVAAALSSTINNSRRYQGLQIKAESSGDLVKINYMLPGKSSLSYSRTLRSVYTLTNSSSKIKFGYLDSTQTFVEFAGTFPTLVDLEEIDRQFKDLGRTRYKDHLIAGEKNFTIKAKVTCSVNNLKDIINSGNISEEYITKTNNTKQKLSEKIYILPYNVQEKSKTFKDTNAPLRPAIKFQLNEVLYTARFDSKRSKSESNRYNIGTLDVSTDNDLAQSLANSINHAIIYHGLRINSVSVSDSTVNLVSSRKGDYAGNVSLVGYAVKGEKSATSGNFSFETSGFNSEFNPLIIRESREKIYDSSQESIKPFDDSKSVDLDDDFFLKGSSLLDYNQFGAATRDKVRIEIPINPVATTTLGLTTGSVNSSIHSGESAYSFNPMGYFNFTNKKWESLSETCYPQVETDPIDKFRNLTEQESIAKAVNDFHQKAPVGFGGTYGFSIHRFDVARKASATITVPDGDAPHGMLPTQAIRIKSANEEVYRTYVIVGGANNDGNQGIATTGTVLQFGSPYARNEANDGNLTVPNPSVMQNAIAVNIHANFTQRRAIQELMNAINSTGGHNNGVPNSVLEVENIDTDSNGPQTFKITQATRGVAGNTQILLGAPVLSAGTPLPPISLLLPNVGGGNIVDFTGGYLASEDKNLQFGASKKHFVELPLRGRPISNFGFPFSDTYKPKDGQKLDLSDYLDGPFLLEKFQVICSSSITDDVSKGLARVMPESAFELPYSWYADGSNQARDNSRRGYFNDDYRSIRGRLLYTSMPTVNFSGLEGYIRFTKNYFLENASYHIGNAQQFTSMAHRFNLTKPTRATSPVGVPYRGNAWWRCDTFFLLREKQSVNAKPYNKMIVSGSIGATIQTGRARNSTSTTVRLRVNVPNAPSSYDAIEQFGWFVDHQTSGNPADTRIVVTAPLYTTGTQLAPNITNGDLVSRVAYKIISTGNTNNWQAVGASSNSPSVGEIFLATKTDMQKAGGSFGVVRPLRSIVIQKFVFPLNGYVGPIPTESNLFAHGQHDVSHFISLSAESFQNSHRFLLSLNDALRSDSSLQASRTAVERLGISALTWNTENSYFDIRAEHNNVNRDHYSVFVVNARTDSATGLENIFFNTGTRSATFPAATFGSAGRLGDSYKDVSSLSFPITSQSHDITTTTRELVSYAQVAYYGYATMNSTNQVNFRKINKNYYFVNTPGLFFEADADIIKVQYLNVPLSTATFTFVAYDGSQVTLAGEEVGSAYVQQVSNRLRAAEKLQQSLQSSSIADKITVTIETDPGTSQPQVVITQNSNPINSKAKIIDVNYNTQNIKIVTTKSSIEHPHETLYGSFETTGSNGLTLLENGLKKDLNIKIGAIEDQNSVGRYSVQRAAVGNAEAFDDGNTGGKPAFPIDSIKISPFKNFVANPSAGQPIKAEDDSTIFTENGSNLTFSADLQSLQLKDRQQSAASFDEAYRKSLTGTVTITAGSTKMAGSGTSFLTEVSLGDNVVIDPSGTPVYAHVKLINSDTEIVLSDPATSSASNKSITKILFKYSLNLFDGILDVKSESKRTPKLVNFFPYRIGVLNQYNNISITDFSNNPTLAAVTNETTITKNSGGSFPATGLVGHLVTFVSDLGANTGIIRKIVGRPTVDTLVLDSPVTLGLNSKPKLFIYSGSLPSFSNVMISGSFVGNTDPDGLGSTRNWNAAIGDKPAAGSFKINSAPFVYDDLPPFGDSPEGDPKLDDVLSSLNQEIKLGSNVSEPAPYVLMPEDKITLGFQTAIPGFHSGFTSFVNIGGGTTPQKLRDNRTLQNLNTTDSSLDIDSGRCIEAAFAPYPGSKLVLYGSYLQDSLPLRPKDSPNNNKTFFEVVGEEVYDQYETNMDSEFGSSMLSEIKSQTTFSEPVFSDEKIRSIPITFGTVTNSLTGTPASLNATGSVGRFIDISVGDLDAQGINHDMVFFDSLSVDISPYFEADNFLNIEHFSLGLNNPNIHTKKYGLILSSFITGSLGANNVITPEGFDYYTGWNYKLPLFNMNFRKSFIFDKEQLDSNGNKIFREDETDRLIFDPQDVRSINKNLNFGLRPSDIDELPGGQAAITAEKSLGIILPPTNVPLSFMRNSRTDTTPKQIPIATVISFLNSNEAFAPPGDGFTDAPIDYLILIDGKSTAADSDKLYEGTNELDLPATLRVFHLDGTPIKFKASKTGSDPNGDVASYSVLEPPGATGTPVADKIAADGDKVLAAFHNFRRQGAIQGFVESVNQVDDNDFRRNAACIFGFSKHASRNLETLGPMPSNPSAPADGNFTVYASGFSGNSYIDPSLGAAYPFVRSDGDPGLGNFSDEFFGQAVEHPSGVKYGMMNYDHIRPSVKFRTHHYGHFRDMLEGRKFGAMAIVDGPKKMAGGLGEQINGQTSAVEVSFIEARTTTRIERNEVENNSSKLFSQNLDKFQRSAVPYFDNEDTRAGGLGGRVRNDTQISEVVEYIQV